jgi:hypothetical protein
MGKSHPLQFRNIFDFVNRDECKADLRRPLCAKRASKPHPFCRGFGNAGITGSKSRRPTRPGMPALFSLLKKDGYGRKALRIKT